MSKRLITILLIISFAFNVAVLGTFIYMRTSCSLRPFHRTTKEVERPAQTPNPEERPQIVENEAVIARADEFRKTRKDLYTELAKDPINEARINGIIEKSLVAQTALERELGASMLELRKNMNADEAKIHFDNRIKRLEERHARREKRTRGNK